MPTAHVEHPEICPHRVRFEVMRMHGLNLTFTVVAGP